MVAACGVRGGRALVVPAATTTNIDLFAFFARDNIIYDGDVELFRNILHLTVAPPPAAAGGVVRRGQTQGALTGRPRAP